MEFFDNDKVIVNPLRLKRWIQNEMENSIVIYFTGKSRDSGKIIEEQKKSVFSTDKSKLEGMFNLKKEAIEMKEDILTGDFNGIAKTMEKGWIAKKQTSSVISNPSIEEDYKFAISHGAKACKISGAGGGGFMIIWCDPVDRFSLIKALNERGKGSARPIQFEERGMQAWTLY
jgi:D-glycero-alpha-D-manno-heptose-7-phosphate kinase